MRRLEFLIKAVREQSDNKDVNGISDKEIIEYFNDGQKLIQNIVFKTNPKANLFKGEVELPANATGIYDLPSNCFGENAITTIETKNGASYSTLYSIDESERNSRYGYYTRDKKIIITGNTQLPIRISYFKRLPKVDKRWALVASTAPNDILLAPVYDVAHTDVDDYCSFVDAKGAQVVKDVFITQNDGDELNTSGDISGVLAGMYLCMGTDSSNVCLLPEECETYLKDYVKQRIQTRNVYSDGGKQNYFSELEQNNIASLFANNTKEVLYPPITEPMDF